MITPGQIRAARALLRWSQGDLGERAGISVPAIANIELEKQQPSIATLEKMERAFVLAGIEIMNDGGVRPRSNAVKVLEGKEGFWTFYTDVFETIRDHGGDVLVSNVDESQFSKWLGDRIDEHRQRMYPLKNYDLRILIQEGDMNFLSKYERCEYRWTPKKSFTDVPFYIYGDKVALINFEPEHATVFLHEHPKITNMFRAIFDTNWSQALMPPQPKKAKK